ncbi:metallophosphoesterase [Bradyrhizobium sp. Arg816]|uniref:metallophosphoesterase family protein n=1 Tax=Bradyrhizobium sp. Arg816 TaxID=2998491 RepID=UPI00249DEB1D|nr:metallophosphoesterase [Bradyrhizobium sp. Arg816]MDI3564150.1 metallophosphoesterase [Bradyrhizobium sp. Arg816]
MLRQIADALSNHSRRCIRALPVGALLLSMLTAAGVTVCRAESPSGEPIGILLAAGDITGCHQTGNKHAEVAAQIQKEIDAANQVPVGILALGDLAYANYRNQKPQPGTYGPCFDKFAATWGVHKDRIFPVPGNHDYSDDITPNKKLTPAKHYRDYFGQRIAELKSATGISSGPQDKRLSFATRFPDKEGWLLAGLNFYGSDVDSKTWLKEQLSASTARCVLVFTHPFFISSGEHGQGEAYTPIAKLMPILYAQGATVLVSGHDHHLEQFPKVDGAGKRDEAKGVRPFVVGTGGATLYSTYIKHPLSERFANKSRGFLKLTLYRDGYKWSFVAVDGPSVELPVGEESCNRKSPA